MKKLVLALGLLVSVTISAQQLDKISKAESDSLAELVDLIRADLYDIVEQQQKVCKFGDHDQSLLLGLGKTLFTDSTTKYKYAEINPRIKNLWIHEGHTGPDNIFPYNVWVKQINFIEDTSKYDFYYDVTESVTFPDEPDPIKTVTERVGYTLKGDSKFIQVVYFKYVNDCFNSISFSDYDN